MRFKSMQDDLVHLRDVAGAYGEDDVAMMRAHHHHLGRGVHVFDATDPVLGRFMLKLERLVHDGGRSHVREILLLLARGEDAGNDDVIGLGKRLREFRAEETRAGEQVRLEDKEDFFVDGLSRGMKQSLCLARAPIPDPDLLILDELSYMSFNKYESELLFKVISERSERSSTIVTTNLSFSEWTQLFENTTMVAALVDRLTYRSHVLDMSGPSYRLQTAQAENEAAATAGYTAG